MDTVPEYTTQGARWLTCHHRNLTQAQVIQLLHKNNGIQIINYYIAGESLLILYYASSADAQRVLDDVKSGMNIAYFFPLLEDGKLTILKPKSVVLQSHLICPITMANVPEYPPQGARWLTCRHRNLSQTQVIQLLHENNSVQVIRDYTADESLLVLYYASSSDAQRVVDDVKSGINIAYFFPLLEDGKLTILNPISVVHQSHRQSEIFVGKRRLQSTMPSIDWWQIGMSFNHSLDKSLASRDKCSLANSKINFKAPVSPKCQTWKNLHNDGSSASSVIEYVSKTEDVPRRLIAKYRSRFSKALVGSSSHPRTRVSPRKCIPHQKSQILTSIINPIPQWNAANLRNQPHDTVNGTEMEVNHKVHWIKATPNRWYKMQSHLPTIVH